MKLDLAIEEYLSWHRMMCHTEKTIINYRDFLTAFRKFIGNMDVFSLDNTCIKKYMIYLSKKDLSTATIGTYMRHIKAFICWLEENKLLPDEELHKKIKFPKAPKKVVSIYSDTEIQLIFQTISANTEWITIRNKAIVSLMLDSGLRREEITKIKKTDISEEKNLLKVCGKGNKERYVPLGEYSKQFINLYLQLCPHSSKLLFVTKNGNDINVNTIKLMIYDLSKELDIKISCHLLRHNFATNYIFSQYEEYGTVDIYRLMALMGHEELKTTQRYLHTANEVIAAATSISKLDKLYNMGV